MKINILLIFIGLLVGIIVFIHGWYMAIKSSYKNLDAVIWCFVGTGIIQIMTLIAAILLGHVIL